MNGCLKDLDKQVWYWGEEDKEDANRALEHCLDGTFLVRESSSPPDKTIHVVYRGVVKMIRIMVTAEGVGLSRENLKFKTVVDTINHFSHVSLGQHNKTLNVRLSNPLPKDTDDELLDEMMKGDETWAIYVNFYLESEIRNKKEEQVSLQLIAAQAEAQTLSYRATAQHMVVTMLKEQRDMKPMAMNHFKSEYLDFIRNNFTDMSKRLDRAESELDECFSKVTQIQAKVRELVLLRDEMVRKRRKLYRKMDWYERLLPMEGIAEDVIRAILEPFNQNLGSRILIGGIKEMWFVGNMDKVESEKLLSRRDNGTFLVRLNLRGAYVLSVVNKRLARHIRIHEGDREQKFWLKPTKQFYSVELLVEYFRNHSLGIQDKDYTTCLECPVYP